MAKKKTNDAITVDDKPARVRKANTQLNLVNPSEVLSFGPVLKDFIIKSGLSVVISGNEYAMVDGWKFAGNAFGLTAIPHKPKKVSEKGQYIKTIFILQNFTNKDKSKTWTKEVIDWIGFADDSTMIDIARHDLEARKLKIHRETTRPYFAYECECDIKRLRGGGIVNYGEGFCSNLETLKAGFDEYSVNSMSQTRSIGKGYRNLLGFVMKSAGFEPTPGEEMSQVGENEKQEKGYTTPAEDKLSTKVKFDDAKLAKAVDMILNGSKTLAQIEDEAELTPEQRATLTKTENLKNGIK